MKSPLRIALLADYPPHLLPGFEKPSSGHTALWLPPLANEFSRIPDLDIHWITFVKGLRKTITIKHLNQTFHLLPRWKVSAQILTAFLSERRHIRHLLKSLQPNLVHAWGTEYGYALAARDSSFPSILSMQGILNHLCGISLQPLFMHLQAHREQRTLPSIRTLTVESEWGREKLRNLTPHSDIHVIEYGVDPSCFDIQRCLSEKPTALYVGSLTQSKGVDTLLRSFTDPRLSHINLILLGDGPLRDSTQAPNIHFPGHVSQAEVRERMSKAWVLVHPTLADTSPNAVKEARVIGLPVVTTPNGGQTAYVAHGESGWVHPTSDTEGLIKGILTITKDRSTTLHMGATDQTDCRERLHPEGTARKFLALYQAVGQTCCGPP